MPESSAPDPAKLLQKIYVAGFELQSFAMFPKAIGVVRGECVALFVPDAQIGLQMLGAPGWRIGEAVGVLTTKGGKKVFQWKEKLVEATDERLELLKVFQEEIRSILSGTGP
ncbi:MAG: hypothetical protein HYX26_07010 [Acidobacteriales bacterium]|nr:hypothetical protein [Terriglobales bacterium]